MTGETTAYDLNFRMFQESRSGGSFEQCNLTTNESKTIELFYFDSSMNEHGGWSGNFRTKFYLVNEKSIINMMKDCFASLTKIYMGRKMIFIAVHV